MWTLQTGESSWPLSVTDQGVQRFTRPLGPSGMPCGMERSYNGLGWVRALAISRLARHGFMTSL